MEQAQDRAATINPVVLERLHSLLSRFLAENCASQCLDNDEEIESVSGKLAHFLLTPGQEIEMNPDQLLPKAVYRMGLTIVDEAKGQKICKLMLRRTPDMTDGDFLQLQNFLWVTLGKAVVENKQLRRTLELAGVIVEDGDTGEQGSPQSM